MLAVASIVAFVVLIWAVTAGSQRSRQAASRTDSLIQRTQEESSYLAYSWRIDSEQPFLVKPAKEIFDERPGDVNTKQFDTMTSVALSSTSSEEFGEQVGSRLGVNVSYRAFSAAAFASSAAIFPSKVRTFRLDNYVIAKQYLVSTNLPNQVVRLKKQFKQFIANSPVERIRDFMGDFYATEITLGGVLQLTTMVAEGRTGDRARLASQVESEGPALLHAAKAGWGRSSSTPTRVAGHEAKTRLQVLGGNSTVWLQLELGGRNRQAVQRMWASSITRENQFPVEYRLTPLWQLLESDPDLKPKALELKHYMTGKWNKAAAKVPAYTFYADGGSPERDVRAKPTAAAAPHVTTTAATTVMATTTATTPTTPTTAETTSLASAGAVAATVHSLVISGCGTYGVNGMYVLQRQFGGCENACPLYKRLGAGTKYQLYHWEAYGDNPQGWYIGVGLTYGTYFAPGDSGSVPTGGWRVYRGVLSHPGLPPPPTVSRPVA